MAVQKNVVFICTGNVCRSPMAEMLFRKLLQGRDDFSVSSAGVSAASGYPASDHTVEILTKRGIDASSFCSKPLTPEIVRNATHLFCMTNEHRQVLERFFPEASDKTYLVCEFCEIDGVIGADIPDPIGLGVEAYDLTCEALDVALPTLLKYIDQTTPSNDSAMNDGALASQPTASRRSGSPGKTSRFAAGADHGGVDLKEALVRYLRESGHEVEDLGTHASDSVDYPDYAHAVAERVQRGECDFGLLVCTSAIGMSIAANRHPGVRAAVLSSPEDAALTREHNHANIICLSGSKTDVDMAKKIVDTFISTPAAEGGRHERRVNKLDAGASPEAILAKVDPEVADAVRRERRRQQDNIELIASENFTSAAVRAAQGSVLTNKYAEGYPGRRWYGGCEYVDVVEQLAIDRAKALFGAEHVNVQAHSGSQANTAVYFSMLNPGDRILTMDLSHGGHLTHGHPANFSGKFYEVVHYGVSEKDERIDYDHLQSLAEETRPKMITAGASAYSRIIDFERMAAIARRVEASLFVDMAHIAGLVAAGVHPSPVPHADFVTTTTHKSLRGPRGGLILCREEHAKKIDSQMFPGIQGGPLMHVIAAKAVCLHEALRPDFKRYQEQVVANARHLAEALARNGFRLISGGTDNHLMLVDLRPNDLNGKVAQETLDEAGITVNKNSIPFDTLSPMKGGGIRVGTPAVTTRGMKEAEMDQIADWIREALSHRGDKAKLEAIRHAVRDLNRGFPLP